MTVFGQRAKLERMSYQWIRASEITDYLYCHRAWWLKRARGVQPQNVRELEVGTRYHQENGRLIQQIIWKRRLAYGVLFCVVTFVVFQVITNWL